MSQWKYTLGESLSGDEQCALPGYPLYVAQAFMAVNYDEDEQDNRPYMQVIPDSAARFVQRWGGLDDTTLLRVLREGRGEDRLLALFALGHHAGLPQGSELLVPFLGSEDQLERCAAACLLALRRDERALPRLEEYLLHDAPRDEQGRYQPGAFIWYASYACRIAYLLGTWGPPSMVGTLRQALIRLWEEEGDTDGEGDVYDHSTQDALCYTLGRRGAMDTLAGLHLPPRRKRLAMVHLALGHVQANERFDDLTHEMLVNDRLQAEVTQTLVKQSGFAMEESQKAAAAYAEDVEKRRYATYGLGERDETPIILDHAHMPTMAEMKQILEEFRARRGW